MNSTSHRTDPPRVRLIGQVDHPDFADAVAALRAGAQVIVSSELPPELIVIAQSRPGMFSDGAIRALRREAPLSGIVALLGTWCEGETRTGRPWTGVDRLYWYEFPAWWRRQLVLHAAGRCPDWARPFDCGLRIADCGLTNPVRNPQSDIRNPSQGLIVINTPVRDTASALADVLQRAGYATLWQPPDRPVPVVRGARAAIWDGGQLSEREESQLAAFCREMAGNDVPVIAMLDFPRRDRCETARKLGATTVLGKPWLHADLVATLEEAAGRYAFATRAA